MEVVKFPNTRNSAVLINGVKLKTVSGIETREIRESIPVSELLSGQVDSLSLGSKYSVKLKINRDEKLPQTDNFTLTVRTPGAVETYRDCSVKTVTQVLSAPNSYELLYEVEAREMNWVAVLEVQNGG